MDATLDIPTNAYAPGSSMKAGGTRTPSASGLGFGDLLDVINPLEHIPVVSYVYRKLTGHTQAEGAEIAGDGLYGGPLGLIGGIVNGVMRHTTGNDAVGHAAVALGIDKAPADKPAAAKTDVASASTDAATAATVTGGLATGGQAQTPVQMAAADPAAAATGIGQTPATAVGGLASVGIAMPAAAVQTAAGAAAAYSASAQQAPAGQAQAAPGQADAVQGATPATTVGTTDAVAPMGTRWFAAPQRAAIDVISARPSAGTPMPASMMQPVRPLAGVNTAPGAATQVSGNGLPLGVLGNTNDPLPQAPVLRGRDGQPIPMDDSGSASLTPTRLTPAAASASYAAAPVAPTAASPASVPTVAANRQPSGAAPSQTAMQAAMAAQGLTLKSNGAAVQAGSAVAPVADANAAQPDLSSIPDPNALPAWADEALQKANQAYRRSNNLGSGSGAVEALPPS